MTLCSGTLSGWNPGSKNHSCERKKCPERGPVREQRTSTRFGVSADTSRFSGSFKSVWFLHSKSSLFWEKLWKRRTADGTSMEQNRCSCEAPGVPPASGKAEQGLSLQPLPTEMPARGRRGWAPPSEVVAPQRWTAAGLQGQEETHGMLMAPGGAGAFPAWGARGGPCSKKTSMLYLFRGKRDLQALRRCALVRF